MKKNSYSKNTVGLLYRNLREKTTVVRIGGERRGNFYTISRGKLQIKINLQLTKKLQTGVLLRKKVNSSICLFLCAQRLQVFKPNCYEESKADLSLFSFKPFFGQLEFGAPEEVSGKGYSGGDIPMLFKYYSFYLAEAKNLFFCYVLTLQSTGSGCMCGLGRRVIDRQCLPKQRSGK